MIFRPGRKRSPTDPSQLLDSSTSVASKYRAARRGRSHDEFTAKLGVVSEEADECVYWLARFKNARIASDNVALEPLLTEAVELSKIDLRCIRKDRPQPASAAATE